MTEQEGDSVARQLTEKFQTDLACGFIYVVDGTRSAEEAAQVWRANAVMWIGNTVQFVAGRRIITGCVKRHWQFAFFQFCLVCYQQVGFSQPADAKRR